MTKAAGGTPALLPAKTHFSASELEAMKLPALPATKRGINLRATRDSWPSRERDGGGGGREYPIDCLPEAARQAILARAVSQAPEQLPLPLVGGGGVPAVPEKAGKKAPSTAHLKTWQTRTMEARAAVLGAVDSLVLTTGASQRQAILAVVEAARAGTLRADVAALVPAANARAGKAGARALSARSVYRWAEERQTGSVVALAPKGTVEGGIPAWAGAFLRLYSRPQKPGIAEILDERVWPVEVAKPSYDQARRFLKKLDTMAKHAGRMGPRALKALQGYHARDVSELWPGAVFIGDGHTYKAEVAHPVSGRPFRPEITVILDVYTRKWVGFSVALAENTWSVADALRHAVTSSTCCAIFYYDNGSGAKNKTWDDDCIGLVSRLGITKLHSAPWSSQSRGIIERFHSSVLHTQARQLDTYVGPRMDKEARQKAYKITRADIKESGTSKLLVTFRDLILNLHADMEAYNNRPHSGLDKTVDPVTAKRRHMSPNEVWAAAVAAGWQADPIPADEAIGLFRPAVTRTVNRGLVSWIGNEYYDRALEHLHGEKVAVTYDLHDADSVTVSLMDGRLICEARWNAHKTSYVPVSMAEKAEADRIAGQLARLDKHREGVLAGASGLVIEHRAPEPAPLTEAQQKIHEELVAELAAPAAVPAEPVLTEVQQRIHAELVAELAPAQEPAPLTPAPLPQGERGLEPATVVSLRGDGVPGDAEARFRLAMAIECRAADGVDVADDDRSWLAGYQRTSEYRGRRLIWDDDAFKDFRGGAAAGQTMAG